METKPRNKLLIALGIFIALSFVYLINLSIYEVTALVLHITKTPELVSLGLVLGFLSISFIVATIIGDKHYNLFTKTYYKLSAVWIGFWVYLFLISLVYAVIVCISQSFVGIGWYLFTLVLLATTYSLFHAQKIFVKNISLSLPNLPTSWKDRKIVLITDLHLGQIHGPKFAEEIVAEISTLKPDMILTGGDFYDGTGGPDAEELAAPFKKLAAPLGVYFVTGNHEEYGDREEFISAVKAVGLRVLDDEMIDIDGLQLIGVSYKNTSNRNEFKEMLLKINIDKQKTSILLKHEPKDLDVAAEAGISFQVSGHTHNGQLWPLGYIAKLTYKGFAYGLKKFETMQVYVSSGIGTWGPPMRLGTRGEIVVFHIQ